MKNIFDWLKEEKINYNDHDLIKQALIHSSYVNENKKINYDNERLEFVGDAVLQIWTAQNLFKMEPELSEGEMTRIRSQVVCEGTLAETCKEIGWNQFILLGAGEEKSGGRNKNSILSDCFEAILGAIYLDTGFESIDIILNKYFISKLYSPDNDDVIDYKTRLQEFIQAESRKQIQYEVESIQGPSNNPTYKINVIFDGITLGSGEGHSKKKAQKLAAKAALEKLVK